jgi:hypothetical protein
VTTIGHARGRQRTTLFHVRDFGATADGTTNDTAAIQRAIDACSAAGGGTVIGGLHSINATLKVTHSNVVLDFGMQAYGESAVESGATWTPFLNWTPEPPFTGLVWDGADHGTMVSFTPPWDNGGSLWSALTGVGFRGSLIAGRSPFTTAADFGVYVSGVLFSHFDAIWTYEFKGAGTLLFAEDRVNGTYSPSVAHNTFGMIGGRQAFNTGAILSMDGPASPNVYRNLFGLVDGLHKNGDAVRVGWADNNVFLQTTISRYSGGTGAGVRILASGTAVGNVRIAAANANHWVHGLFGAGGFIQAEGANTANTGTMNRIDIYDYDQSADGPSPVYGPIGEVFWNRQDRLVKNTGNYSVFAVPYVLQDIDAGATVAMSIATLSPTGTDARFPAVFGGYVVGLSVIGTAVTSGSITFKATIAGAQQSMPNETLTGVGAGVQSPGLTGPTFTQSQTLGIDAVTTGDYSPTMNVYKALLYLAVPVL